MDTSKYKELYLQETQEHLSGIEQGLLTLEKEPSDQTTVDNLFRHYHSIKGMSASMGYEPVKTLAHAQEDLLDRIRSKRLHPTGELTGTLLQCLDEMKELVKKVAASEPLDDDIEPFVKMIKALIETTQTPVAASGAPSAPPAAPMAPEAQTTEVRISNIMKVDGRVFDELLTIVGDIFMALSSFKTLSHTLKSIAFKDGVHLMGKTVNRLHDNILSARMLPIEDLTTSLPRVVRDMTQKTGKKVQLKTQGTEISLDKAILENLGSPLVHIIRNCIDHGIETPEEREKAGKGPDGSITIKAFTKMDRVVISIADDGKGIDVEKVMAKAAGAGISRERIDAMNPKARLMLICLPGVSAAEKVTETSGRGVGMDIVKNSIEAIGGTLDISSVRGAGTEINIELPRTTAIIKTLIVKTADEIFLLPLSKVKKVLEVRRDEIQNGIFNFNGASVPVIDLKTALGLEGVQPLESGDAGDATLSKTDTCTIILAQGQAETNERQAEEARSWLVGIHVDDFGDEIDAYIKPLLPPMSKLKGASGITIMGDGRPVFLLDIPQIASNILKAC